MVAQRPTVSLQDIADLAHVRRHVVSMWRRRPSVRGRLIPFPQPVTSAGDLARFDRDEIVEYLSATGRGRNTDAAQDAPTVAAPDGVDVEDVVTLLCLQMVAGVELEDLSARQLTEVAQRADPDDRYLLGEVRDLDATPELLRYVDDVVAASFGGPDALTRVESGRLRRVVAERGLTDELMDLVCSVVEAARLSLSADAVTLAPPADRRLTRRLAGGFAGIVVGDDDGARARHRRALLDGIDVRDDLPATVRVLSVVGEPDAVALESVDHLTVSLAPTDVAVVIGAAAVLCDPLAGKAAQDRSQTLRDGNLAMAVRLPRGLWKGAHRQSLALWILSGARGARSLWLADLDTETTDLDDLASDVLAALQRTENRAYRYARRGELATVLADAAVVPRGIRAIRLAKIETAAHLDRIHTATLTTSEPVPGYDVAVAPAPGQVVLRRRSLGELRAAGQLVMRRGTRIDPGHGDPAGTVRVLSADGAADALRLDPFDADRLYARATPTEPGDVVFVERPRPLARVDTHGGALVASPSRILRIPPGVPIGPHSLAAIINEVAPTGSEWQTWLVPDLPPDEGNALDQALAAAATHKAMLRRHDLALRDLVTSLIQGVAAGAVTFDTTITRAG